MRLKTVASQVPSASHPATQLANCQVKFYWHLATLPAGVAGTCALELATAMR
jgi:hypothetical protein